MSEVATPRTNLLTPTAAIPYNSRQTTSPQPKTKLFESGLLDGIKESNTSNGSDHSIEKPMEFPEQFATESITGDESNSFLPKNTLMP